MKYLNLALLVLVVLVSRGEPAQHADKRVAELVNSEEWFALEQEYPALKDSIHADFMKLVAEAMIGWKFNRKDDALDAVEKLLSKHQTEIGSQAATNFAMMRLRLLGELGRYAEAADGAKKLLSQLSDAGPGGLETLRSMYAQYNSLRDIPPMSISRPNRDAYVPFTIQGFRAPGRETWMKPGRTDFQGYLMTIPVTVHGKQLPFIFDTGASSTFIMEKTARDLGLRILPDTIILNGNQKGLRAYIDSLQVGEVTVRNMIAYVGLPNALDGVVSGIDAVLGMDFINAIGETQILFDEWQLKFPYMQTPMPATGRNLTNDMLMKASKDGHMLQFTLDTGDTTAELYAAYYEKFRKEVEADAVRDRITKGSYGNVSTIETLFLPNGVSFKVGSTPVNIDEIYLLPKSADRLHHHDGRMGMDLIRRFRKTTINLRDMFVKFEE